MDTTTSDKPDTEKTRLIQLLGTLYKTAEHASLTGALRNGAEDAAGYYNRALARFVERDEVSESLFPPLDPALASFGQVGVAAKLLAGYLYDGPPHRTSEYKFDFEGLSHLGEVGKRIRDEFKFKEGKIRIHVGHESEEAEEAEEAREAEA